MLQYINTIHLYFELSLFLNSFIKLFIIKFIIKTYSLVVFWLIFYFFKERLEFDRIIIIKVVLILQPLVWNFQRFMLPSV